MTPELEADLRTTVASLRVRTACQELLILALLPALAHHQKDAIRERLDLMEGSEVVPRGWSTKAGSKARRPFGSSRSAKRWRGRKRGASR